MAKVDGKNTRAVKKMLSGEHKSQTKTVVGWEPTNNQSSKNEALKEVGDTWKEYINDELVAVWEQCDGYRLKHSPSWTKESKMKKEEILDYLSSYPNCYDDCTTKTKTRLDEKFRRLSGMCADCHFRMEEKLKLNGEYETYIKKKMYNNAVDWFKDADKEIRMFAEQIKNGYTYVNENGTHEKWFDDIDPDEMLKEYEEAKQQTLDKFDPNK